MIVVPLCGCTNDDYEQMETEPPTTQPPTTQPPIIYEQYKGDIWQLFPVGMVSPGTPSYLMVDECGVSSATYCEGAIFPIHNKYGDNTYLAIHIYKVDEATMNTLLEKRGIRVGDAYLDSPIEYDVGFEASNLSFCGGHASPSSCAYLLRYTYMDVIVKIVLADVLPPLK